ncbi:peroxiredoxin [Candidatus Comchoanobacter bicostacola]|uniref:thioredoxin-dependent peroxiredoxin n=1 Tax=Candidatus Comchoanobacter bicostacola TaxID=2919598 RepID=A0ABY5DN24_9GAMM|nr:peroxiredoxin [Candidatus Comchoanobacter bicostacola]UTC24940.1 peroxiredoxin [Candidatus Comchoanobacter bicostacola]
MIDLNQEVIIDSGQPVKLGALYSDKLLIYFYPKDMTSGCTKQAVLFQEQQERFNSLGCKIVGVSRDSIKRHNKFKQTYGLTFDLIADTQEQLCHQFKVMAEKSMYGKTYLGIVRSSFLLDKKGAILKEWRNVKVASHMVSLLSEVKVLINVE